MNEKVVIVSNGYDRIDGRMDKAVFNQETDTRGHFNKEIL
jgi:putative protease